MQRAVNAEAKTGLRSSAIVQNSDICFPRGYRPSNNTALKVQTEETSAKEPRLKKSRPKEAKPGEEKASTLPWANAAESSEQSKRNKKDKKQRFRKRKKQTLL